MSGYQHGKSAQPLATILTVEQARRRNAELRRELAALTVENVALDAQVSLMRGQVTAARKTLSRKVRDLDAARAQIDQLAAVEVTALPTPKYGGREGLEAATKELEDHVPTGALQRRRSKGPSHGTRTMYDRGCNCDKCLGWRRRKTEQTNASQKAKRARLKAEAQRKVAA